LFGLIIMVDIIISDKLKQVCSNIRLGVIKSDIKYEKKNKLLWYEIEQVVSQIKNSLSQNQIAELSVIRHTRDTYLALGKEPARYRCSAEALLRRVIQGKELYQINNAVDIINLISLLFYFSIGCYDYDKLTEPIVFDIGKEKESYQAIGRGMMNIAHLPVFRDSRGAFGSPTSDSERSMITAKTREIVIVIIDFKGTGPLQNSLEKTLFCLQEFAGAKNSKFSIIV